ncbi:nucleotide kinase domain-containing protein [Tannerella forsythia]|uniref:nucleotide kinase domain-containing protein n=1 Tax=Tannerella forsythia TaxID=28112 RepID=UPI0028EFADC3|nr:nucleotide kinase domain-containing protein [Tannerella forsythia]
MMVNHKQIIPNDDILRYYFYFMQERMSIFWRKYEGHEPLTEDPILKKYRFTNVYRACDRVSQYLIRDVISKDIEDYTPQDMLLRILVYKIFNKIETWEYVEQVYGKIRINHFDVTEISNLLSERRRCFPIFNNAYMMTGTHKKYNYLPSKHEKWLSMVKEEFLGNGVVESILNVNSLEGVYRTLRKCSFLGDFFAYQFAIDFNYSPYLNYSENSFVKAGIGAIRGIKKCFVSYGDSFEDAIHYVHDNIDVLRARYGYTDFRPLPGHEPTLLDLQNCFCETDKYLREKVPTLQVGNIRIKQKYNASRTRILFSFPEKWGVEINQECTQKNLME